VNLPVTFSQNITEPVIKEASGKILSVNILDSTVVARFSSDETGESYNDVMLSVDSDTLITSQDSSLAISDLKPESKVVIVYETNSDGQNTAKSIMVR
jgi:lipopolysaccharide biosynthesis glycosyltransferase